MSCTSFDLSGFHRTLEATEPDGNKVTFLVEHTPAFLDMFIHLEIDPPRFKKEPTEIIDIRGADDGANSIIKVKWNHFSCPGEKEVLRVRETTDDLILAFKRAGLASPRITRSASCSIKDFGAGLCAATRQLRL